MRIRGAFSLIELTIVISILALMCAIIFPILSSARENSRQSVCSSNLKQIGISISVYQQDYDSFYPYAVDPSDRVAPSWHDNPHFQSQIPQLPDVEDILQPYIKSKQVFACPSDTGFLIHDFAYVILNAYPTSFEKYGTSYYYRTELSAMHSSVTSLTNPDKVNVLLDGSGNWHGSLVKNNQRYNILFADGHVKNVLRDQAIDAWSTPLGASP